MVGAVAVAAVLVATDVLTIVAAVAVVVTHTH